MAYIIREQINIILLFKHYIYVTKKSGQHIVQSYDENLTDTKGIGNTCVGLTMYEMKLCIKKMKQKGWKMIKEKYYD